MIVYFCFGITFNHLGSVRSLVERCIHRLKIFRCLSSRFRHALDFHGLCFRAVINLVELSTDYLPVVHQPHPALFENHDEEL